MENYSYSSYADSGDSSPQSREIDCDNPSWDEPLNYKVKLMCSYGGKIHPRPHDNQLAYVGGDTKILAVDRNIRFSGMISKLASLCDADVCFKYQLPGEDLDALISVTNEEDLEHMMLEYDRLQRISAKPARLRLFLFPLNPPASKSVGSNETKIDREWFVEALNSVPIQNINSSSPPASNTQTNPDFLFGFDKGHSPTPPQKNKDSTPDPPVPELSSAKISVGSDLGKEDREIGSEPLAPPAEIQRQIQEMQRMQIASQEQAMKRSDENLARAFAGDLNMQQNHPQKIAPAPAPAPAPASVPVPLPASVSVPTGYWQERHMPTGYPSPAATGSEQPVYLYPTPMGMYQSPNIRPVTGQTGQGYYAMQRMVQDVYREPPVYSMGPPPPPQQPKVGAYAAEGIGMVRPTVGVPDMGFTQVAYDSTGRQVFYTAPGGVVPSYQTVATAGNVDVRQTGQINQEGKTTKPS